MKYLFSLLFIFFHLIGHSQNFTLSGMILDEKGEELPYTNVVITGTSQGTSANFEGKYAIELPAGKYSFTYQFIGYKSQTHEVDLTSGNVVLDITLLEEVLNLREVVVNSNGEDPAYDIIRKAQKARKEYLNEFPQYKNKSYTKLFAQAERAGIRINLFGTPLVSEEGVFYLSESFSDINATSPQDRSETLVASLLSGDTSQYSANKSVFPDFYRNRTLRVNTIEFVSPIAADAFSYYDYEYEGYFMENDVIINKVKLIPKQSSFPAYTGHIYVIEDSWRLYGVHAFADAKSNSIGDIELKVAYTFLQEEKLWLPFSVDFFLKISDTEAFYHTIHSDYSFNKNEIKEVPAALRYRIADGARSKSDDYWASNRPIPLTDEEAATYQKDKERMLQELDSIASIKENPEEVVKEEKKERSPSFASVLLSSGRYQLNKQWSLSSDQVLLMINFNTVEGWVLDHGFTFTKTHADERKLTLKPRLRYGFSSNQFYGKLDVNYELNLKKPEKISLSAGHYVSQISGTRSISPQLNSLYTLAVGENYLKLYERSFANVKYQKELINGLDLILGTGYTRRNSLQNTSDFSFRGDENTSFTPNVAVINDQVENFEENSIFEFNAQVNIAFRRPYNELPNKKEILESRFPLIKLAYQGGRGDSDFNLLWANVSDTWEVGTWGRSRLSASYGNLVSSENLIAPDFLHFSGNQTLITQRNTNYGLSYQLLDYYQFSTNEEFFGANFSHDFKGKILRKLPLIKKTKASIVLSGNYLNTPAASNYFEVGAGISDLFDTLDIGYFQSYLNGSRFDEGVRFSLNITFGG